MAKGRSKDRIYITHLTIVIAGRKKKVKRIIPILVILLLLSSGFVGVSVIPSSGTNVVKKTSTVSFDGNTLYVGGSGSGNYTKIQDAIDNASEGDTVFVFSGTYFGHININKSINLIGENKNTTFITGFLAYTISIVADWVNISGFTIQNDGRSGEGVRIDSCYNNFINNIIDTPNDNIRISGDYNTISGNTITGDSIILSGDSNTISGNTISNNDDGIYLTDSCDNIISNNSFFNSGLFISEYTVCNNIVTNNTMNGKPLVYVYDESDLVLDVDAGQIILVNCTNITVQNQEIFNTTVGIQIWGSNTCFISGNTIAGNHYGICINGWNNTINDNTITNNNYDGMRLSGDSNTISGNTISNNDDGIYLYCSDYNNIINNTITNNNYDGIRLSGYNNTISGNTISNNDKGISVGGQSRNNIIYHNNFVNNIQNTYDTGMNIWDNSYPSCGNYWDDYSGIDNYSGSNQDISGPDGISDTPYSISGGENKDRYPLMEPYGMTKLTMNIGWGLLKFSGSIKNIGNKTAFNVQWKITIDGGFILFRREFSGHLPRPLLAGEELSVSSGIVFGFGRIVITVAVWADNAPLISESIPGTLFLIFLML